MGEIREDELQALYAEFDAMQDRRTSKWAWTPEQEAVVLHAMDRGLSICRVQKFFRTKGWPVRAHDTITTKYNELKERADS